MMMLIRFSDGRSEQAILLANRGKTLRVALRNRDDSAELRFDRGTWLSESNDPVLIERLSPRGDKAGGRIN
jgi:hypothetical protein